MKNVKIPNHLGIIMDGNGRWAENKGKKRSQGHLEGSKTLKKIINYGFKKGINVISVFAFSTENFKRSKEEVDYLMNLFVKIFKTEFKQLKSNNIKVIFSGKKENLPKNVVNTIKQIENETKENNNKIFNICLNYGGKQEIIDTTKKICEKYKNEEIDINDINENLFNKNLYKEIPQIDFVIRTSGEMRISNFMIWQLAYAEMYFPKVYWPDFNEIELDKALEEYTKRDRRFGGINYETKNN